jgi:hypothetical protein
MNITSKPIRLGVPTLIILGLVAVIAFMAWGTGGASGGLGATSMLRGTVEYTVFDANGKIKDHGIDSNAVAAAMLTAARETIGIDFDELVNDDGLFNAIELCASDGDTTITADACTSLSTPGNIDESNPQNGTSAAVNTDAYSVTLTFTASNAVVIEGFHLCGITTQIDNQVCLSTEIGAFQNTGTINLADIDTIQVVWTITFAAA